MRITTLLLITVIMQASAGSFAQKISLSEKKAPLASVFLKISQQSGYDFLITGSMLKDTKPVTIDVKNVEVSEVLKLIFKDQPVDYNVQNKIVTVSPKENPSFMEKVINSFLDIRVSGQVVDEKGKGMPGATIRVKGKDSTTPITTSSEGSFSLIVPGENAVLVVSYIGYKTKEVNVSGADVDLVIRMEPMSKNLEEIAIVSTGYQDIPKERATGSFEKIDNASLNRNTGGNILMRLENVTPGMLANRRLIGNDEARLDAISIRGLSTLTATITAPLVILDNFPYEGDINNLNPNDVESVTILKDAAASSIWGARAANGVIVITTKKGKYNQAAQITLSSNITIREKRDLSALKIMSSSDYIDLEKKLFREGAYNDKIDDVYSWPYLSPVIELMLKAREPGATLTQAQADAQIDAFRNIDVRSDYMKYLYRAQIAQQHALNINGGGNQFSYQISGGYDYNRLDIVKRNNDRITLRTAFNYKPIQDLELEAGLFYTQKKNESVGRLKQPHYSGNMLPYIHLADENGTPVTVGAGIGSRFLDTLDPRYLDWRYRPLAELDASRYTEKTYDLLMNLGAKYQLSRVFSLSLKYQYGRTLSESTDWNGQNAYFTRDYINRLTEFDGTEVKRNLPLGSILDRNNGNDNSYNLRGQLNVSKTWNDNHDFNAIAGAEQSERVNTANSSRVYGYNDELLTYADVDHTKEFISPLYNFVTMPSNIDFTDTRYRFISYFANAAYTFKQRYTISGSGRKDAANLFGVNTNLRGAPFWSSGLSWNISKEPFYKFGLIPDLKLRLTYGYQGNTNNQLSAFSTITYLPFPDSDINQPFAYIANPANDDLRWERVGTLNLGIDFGSRNQVISGSIEYYTKKSTDVLSTTPIDNTTGFQSTTYNSASLKGRGIDISLHSNNLKGNLKWNTDLFFNYNTNKVTKFTPVFPSVDTYLNTNGVLSTAMIVGKPALSLFSYRGAGLDPATGDPMGYINGAKSKDYAALTDIGLEDLQYHGSAAPVYSGAIRNTVNYKNFSLSVNITAKLGYVFRRKTIEYSGLLTSMLDGLSGGHSDYALRWQKTGDEQFTTVPSFVYPGNEQRDKFYLGSAALVSNASHFRLQDVILSYTLNKPNWSLKNIRVFANAGNLGLLWKANKFGLDPEYYEGYPAARTIAVGLNANF